ncbi:pentapeptide repeat-containing protein [Thermomonospora umbrina]|uniref:Pentapeptide repeat protein n=1 Tax=Thermomonospora umbrina TaxID=111806 RepID=A0A3D9SYV1_9ACTN|nr:pentapeptide repeat-containing protein [Thermomonospora umbrina]REE99213.1 pentapeptide repeat protein [Thermomonospora umbrina]
MTPAEHDYTGRTFGAADFRDRVFDTPAIFTDCVFTERPDFSGAVFKARVFFTRAVFERGVDFHETTFEKFANFEDVAVTGDARFTGAVFETGLLLEHAEIDGVLRLDRVQFHETRLMGPLRAKEIDFRLVVFHRRARLEFVTGLVRCERASFYGGVQFQLDGADIILKDSELGPASRVATYTAERERYGRPARRPRLVTVSGTDVATLSISRADLSACKLMHAHNLDLLRVRTDDAFGLTPRRLRLARREVIGDEVRWRAEHGGGRRARERWRPPVDWPDVEAPQLAGEVVKTYRALRKGREDSGDGPGAADFYYGEMEMRRLGSGRLSREQWRNRSLRGWTAATGEYVLLSLYWLVSGYGLRAWRSFTALAVVVALAAAGFMTWGFPAKVKMDYGDSFRFTLRAATSLLRGTEAQLTPTGEWIELVLRFLGPVLLGLGVLAVRGRVRR